MTFLTTLYPFNGLFSRTFWVSWYQKGKSHHILDFNEATDDLVALASEMIQTTGDIGTQWLLDLCNGIVREGCIPQQ